MTRLRLSVLCCLMLTLTACGDIEAPVNNGPDDPTLCTTDSECTSKVSCEVGICNKSKGTCSFTVSAGKCLVSDTCYNDGQGEPGVPCKICRADLESYAFINKTCDDGLLCEAETGDCISDGSEQCGDGQLTASETCDDGNVLSADGCDVACGVEAGWECPTPGAACTDIDECSADTVPCDTNATCTNTEGSFTCACNAGFEGDGTSCADVDECAAVDSPCAANATCTNEAGAYSCACNAGFEGDGTSCTDVDECAAVDSPCAANATCSNEAGAYSCACNAGFEGDGTSCADVDECAAVDSPCAENATCSNEAGAYSCVCNAGFEGDGTSCADVDECAASESPCSANATCTNNEAGYACACHNGFEGDGMNCANIDECAAGTDTCNANGACVDTTPGVPDCQGECDNGLCLAIMQEWLPDCGETLWDGTKDWPGYCSLCAQGDPAVGDFCVDFVQAACVAKEYNCGCDAGFEPTGENGACLDINECVGANLVPTNICAGVGDECVNTEGSYSCTCPAGYSVQGNGFCEDTDECASGSASCVANSSCQNTPGSYQCLCNDGFSGAKKSCENVDECAAGLDACGDLATCVDHTPLNPECTGPNACDSEGCVAAVGVVDIWCLTHWDESCASCASGGESWDGSDCSEIGPACDDIQSYSCACDAGYKLLSNGLECEDINECAVSNGGCAQDCTNTGGDFECSCGVNYTLSADGLGCDDVNECDVNNGGCAQTCANKENGFTCSCAATYTLSADGLGCDDVNECDVNNGGCAQTCANKENGFTCSCAATYTLSADGLSCDDINECLQNNGGCDDNAICTNSEGGYSCACGPDYVGDGFACELEVPIECAEYAVIDDPTRNVNSTGDGVTKLCDQNLSGWHRFQGAAGTQMPTYAPEIYHCGTSAPGWLNGSHPTVEQGAIAAQACFNWDGNSCQWSTDISVRNCGDYYVYNLQPTNMCSLAYCGTANEVEVVPYVTLLDNEIDPTQVFDQIERTNCYGNNLAGGFFVETAGKIVAPNFSGGGYYLLDANDGNYEASPNESLGGKFHRMVYTPKTARVLVSQSGYTPAWTNELLIGYLSTTTGKISGLNVVNFDEPPKEGECRLISSTSDEFLCLAKVKESWMVTPYLTSTKGSAVYAGNPIWLEPGPLSADQYSGGSYGGQFAADGVFFYFPAGENGQYGTTYHVFSAESGKYAGKFDAKGNGNINSVYFDWNTGRYASHDGFGVRSGGTVYGSEGPVSCSDTDTWSFPSKHHAAF